MLYKKLLCVIICLNSFGVFAQKSQGIGTNTPNPRAVLDINVEAPGTYPQGLLLPRLTTAQRNSLSLNSISDVGMSVYDITDKNFYTWDGFNWKSTGSIVNTIVGIGGITLTNVGGNFTVSGGSNWTKVGSNINYALGNVGVGIAADNSVALNIQNFNTSSNHIGIKNTINSYTGSQGNVFGIFTDISNSISNKGKFGYYSNVNKGGGDTGELVAYGGNIANGNPSNFPDYFFKGAFSSSNGTRYGLHISGESQNYLSTSLGIGTVSPQASLHVIGNATVSGLGGFNALRIASLSVSGSVLTVDGQGNLGMGTIAAGIGGAGTVNGIAYFTNNNTITADGANFRFTKGNFVELKLGVTTFRSSSANGDNLFIGRDAGNALATGNSNSIFGFRSGENITTASENSFYGFNSGQNSGSGQSNSFYGYNSGQNTSGQQNSFYGHSTGTAASTGNENSFFGHTAGQSTTSSSNSFFGKGSGLSNIGGAENSFFGRSSGSGNTTGNNNSFFGRSAGIANISGSNNIAIGHSANFGFSNLNNAIAIGSNVMVSGSNQAVIGSNITGLGINTNAPTAMLDVNGGARIRSLSVSGSMLTVDGLGNLGMGTIDATPNYFTFTGGNIRTLNNTDNIQIASTAGAYMIGTNTGLRMTDKGSLFLGNGAGNMAISAGPNNIFIGTLAGSSATNGGTQNSIFIGTKAGSLFNGAVSNNVFIGNDAGGNSMAGSHNIFLGLQAGRNNSNGNFNNFFGWQAGLVNSGHNNNFLGVQAGGGNTTGSGNNFFGYQAGLGNATGSYNIAIGYSADMASGALTNSIAIGQNAIVSGSNSVVIGNNITSLGINTNAPTAMLDVNGGARIRNLSVAGTVISDALGNLSVSTVAGGASQWISSSSNQIYTNSFVGIGTTAPGSRLYVGDVGINTSIFGTTFRTNGGVLGAAVGSELSMGSMGFQTTSNQIGLLVNAFRVHAGTDWSNTAILMQMGVDNDVRVRPSNYIALCPTTSSGQGRIGIGTIEPQSFFEIRANENGWLQTIKGTAASGGIGEFTGLKLQVGYPGEFSKWAGVAAVSESSNANNVGMAFYTASQSLTGTERVRISNTGAVGIGVNTFTGFEALRINSTNPADANRPKGLVFPYVTTAQMVTLSTSGLGLLDAGMVYFNTDRKDVEIWDGTQWKNNGGGGGGSNSFNTNWQFGGNTLAGVPFLTASGTGKIGSTDNMNVAVVTNNQTRIFLGTTGGVGINNANNQPKSTLQVNGDVGLGDGTDTGNKPVVVWLTNTSGAIRNQGEIVIVDPNTTAGFDDSFTVTNTLAHNSAIGVLTEQCNIGNVCKIAVSGIVSVKTTGTIIRGQHCVTAVDITSGLATSTAMPSNSSSIGVFLQSVSSGSTARVLLR